MNIQDIDFNALVDTLCRVTIRHPEGFDYVDKDFMRRLKIDTGKDFDKLIETLSDLGIEIRMMLRGCDNGVRYKAATTCYPMSSQVHYIITGLPTQEEY